VTNLPNEWEFKTTYNDNETDKSETWNKENHFKKNQSWTRFQKLKYPNGHILGERN